METVTIDFSETSQMLNDETLKRNSLPTEFTELKGLVSTEGLNTMCD